MAGRIVQAAEETSHPTPPPADGSPVWLVRFTWVSLGFWLLASWRAEEVATAVQVVLDEIEIRLGLDTTLTSAEDA